MPEARSERREDAHKRSAAAEQTIAAKHDAERPTTSNDAAPTTVEEEPDVPRGGFADAHAARRMFGREEDVLRGGFGEEGARPSRVVATRVRPGDRSHARLGDDRSEVARGV